MLVRNRNRLLVSLAIALLALSVPVRAQGGIYVPTPRGSGETLDDSAGGGMIDPSELTSIVYTRMGDQLRGRVLELTTSNRLRFNAPYLAGDASLLRSAIERVVFTDPEPELAIDRVFVTNGDRIAGEVQQLDDASLLIKTGSGVYVPIPRDVIRRIAFGAGSAVLLEADFTGGSMSPFRAIEGDWRSSSGTLTAPYDPRQGGQNAIVSAELAQEGSVTVAATIGATDRQMNFDIVLFADENGDGRGQNCVLATFYWNRVSVQMVRNRQHSTLGDTTFNRVANKPETDIRMTYDPEDGTMAIWFEGTKVGTYTIREPVTAGKYVNIVSRGPLTVKNFRLLRGVVEEPTTTLTPRKDKALVFTGADSAGTQVQADEVSIADGKARIKTEWGQVDYPLKDIAEIVFPTDGLRELEPKGNAIVRTSASKFTVDLQTMNEKTITFKSELYNEITLNRSFVREIVMHQMQ